MTLLRWGGNNSGGGKGSCPSSGKLYDHRYRRVGSDTEPHNRSKNLPGIFNGCPASALAAVRSSPETFLRWNIE